MRRIHIFILGEVQGIFFRKNIKEQAHLLGLKGRVRNFEDKVEIVAEGSEDAINQLIEYCKKGPEGAKVDKVDANDEDPLEEFSSFEIRY